MSYYITACSSAASFRACRPPTGLSAESAPSPGSSEDDDNNNNNNILISINIVISSSNNKHSNTGNNSNVNDSSSNNKHVYYYHNTAPSPASSGDDDSALASRRTMFASTLRCAAHVCLHTWLSMSRVDTGTHTSRKVSRLVPRNSMYGHI